MYVHHRYVPCGVLRLTKAQLDGACSDNRFDEEFFIDLIFAPVEKSTSKTPLNLFNSQNSPTDSGLLIDLISSDKYEQSLHRDTRFWDAVQTRKIKSKKRRSRKYISNATDQFSIMDEGSNSVNEEEMDSIRFSAVTSSSSNFGTSSSGRILYIYFIQFYFF